MREPMLCQVRQLRDRPHWSIACADPCIFHIYIIHICIYACTFVCVCVCMCVGDSVYIYRHIYT